MYVTIEKAQTMYQQIESKRSANAAQTDAFFKSAKAVDYFTGVLEVHRVAARIKAAIDMRGSVPAGRVFYFYIRYYYFFLFIT